MKRNISIYIKDILENMENILNFTKNLVEVVKSQKTARMLSVTS